AVDISHTAAADQILDLVAAVEHPRGGLVHAPATQVLAPVSPVDGGSSVGEGETGLGVSVPGSATGSSSSGAPVSPLASSPPSVPDSPSVPPPSSCGDSEVSSGEEGAVAWSSSEPGGEGEGCSASGEEVAASEGSSGNM